MLLKAARPLLCDGATGTQLQSMGLAPGACGELWNAEQPDRVRELEAWGAVFDRTPDGKILQRNFGGHRYPRLAHVGDRAAV